MARPFKPASRILDLTEENLVAPPELTRIATENLRHSRNITQAGKEVMALKLFRHNSNVVSDPVDLAAVAKKGLRVIRQYVSWAASLNEGDKAMLGGYDAAPIVKNIRQRTELRRIYRETAALHANAAFRAINKEAFRTTFRNRVMAICQRQQPLLHLRNRPRALFSQLLGDPDALVKQLERAAKYGAKNSGGRPMDLRIDECIARLRTIHVRDPGRPGLRLPEKAFVTKMLRTGIPDLKISAIRDSWNRVTKGGPAPKRTRPKRGRRSRT